jgi:phosphopantetheine adenylyltransferase
MSNVVPLHPPQPLLAGYLRVGHDGHRRLPHMLNVGRLKYKRFVFDAACNDQECCVHANDMIDRHDEHFITQRSKQLQDLAKFPADKRTEHFLLNHVGAAVRMGELSAKLRIEDETLKKALKENKKRLQRMQEALMTVARGNLSFSKVPAFRGCKNRINAMMVR